MEKSKLTRELTPITENKTIVELSRKSQTQVPVKPEDYPRIMFKTQYNKVLFPTKGEVNNQASLTVPDETMSVSEIMRRYVKGLPMGSQRVPLYEEDDNDAMPDLSRMDKADRMMYAKEAADELSDIKEKIEKDKKDKQEKQSKKYKQQELELKNLKEKNTEKPNDPPLSGGK